ncbi:MAG: ATP-binding protein [Reinekea sp.]
MSLVALVTLVGWLTTWLSRREVKSQLASQSYHLDMMRKAARAAQGGIYIYKVKRNETYWDKNTLSMFGLEGEGRMVKPGIWEQMLHPEDRERAINTMSRVMDSDQVLYDQSYRIIRSDGEVRWIEGSGFVIRDERKQPLEITGLHFDITNQARQEEELKRSKHRAVQAMEAKTKFLANMSHEIRTPMNAIIGMIELLSFEALSPIQRRYIYTLRNSSEVLLRIINDVLDVSKIEAGKLQLEQQKFTIRDVLQQCLSVHTQASEHKNLLLTGYIDSTIPAQITGDSTRLQQVIMNLLSNAFKFTTHGHILLKVEMTLGQEIQVSIEDTGIGIAPEHLERLFERFTQADDSTTRKFGGTGLGLTIVREIVHLWGGNIWVNSEFGHGATFHFTMPISESQQQQSLAEGRYLLACRFEVIARLWQEAKLSPHMTWVNNIADLKKALNSDEFDEFVVEQRFPDMRGSELVSWCKKNYPKIRTTLIGFESVVRTAQENKDIDSFVARPYYINQLWDNHFARATIQPSKPENRWPDFSHVRVLCVDDNPSNLVVLSGLLKRLKVQCALAESGFEAVEMSKHEDFDLVLMDYEMPKMDGPGAARQMLENKEMLIIGLSAHTGELFQYKAESAGMKGFLRKPIRISELIRLLNTHFNAAKTDNSETVENHP